MMLSDFCNSTVSGIVKKLKNASDKDIIISAGGSFRLAFDDEQSACDFLEYLAEHYRKQTGGTLTTAGPVEYDKSGNATIGNPVANELQNDFGAKNRALTLQLLEAKLNRAGAEAVKQMPITAVCTSCGTELAAKYDTPTRELPEDERVETYLCSNCLSKAEERHNQKSRVFNYYREAIQEWEKNNEKEIDYPLTNPLDPPKLIGSLDPTQYVGYILADANGMGKQFNKCESEGELRHFSEKLEKAMWVGLADPIAKLIERLDERKLLGKLEGRMPIVPLIVGGDDLLALVPARYALDIARRLCEQFEKQMQEEKATLGLAVIICQNHYPYTLAYERGKYLLDQAKKRGKNLGQDSTLSAINFEMVVGNELKNESMKKSGQNSSGLSVSLKPYWVWEKIENKSAASAGKSLSILLDQRLLLKDLPRKRLAELRRHFDLVPNINKLSGAVKSKILDKWYDDLEALQVRINSPELNKAIFLLGNEKGKTLSEMWKIVSQPNQPSYPAHGLLDLIEVWDYAYKLDEPDNNYRPEAS